MLTPPTLPSPTGRGRAASRRQVLALLAAALVLTGVSTGVVGAGPAAAHVQTGAASDVAPDGTATMELTFAHGCGEEPTTSLRVQVPAGVTQVTPQPKDGWAVQSSATEFGWTGGSVPSSQAATFTATMVVSGQAGQVIYFPTLQGCPTAEEAWIAIPAAGQAEPPNPAPSITLPSDIAPPATTSTSAAPTTTTPTLTSPGTTVAPAATSNGGSSNSGLLVGMVTVLIIAGGAVALYVRNRGRGRS